MSDYSVTLSTTEPNNYVGLIKLRQGDVASQSIQATITANGQLFNFDHLDVFFNAVLPNGYVVRDKVSNVDYANSKLNYVVADSFLQEVAQVTAWFSFENDEKIIDSTKNFQYSVIGGWKECIPQGNYIYELSEIQREIEEIIGNKDFTSIFSKISSIEKKYDEQLAKKANQTALNVEKARIDRFTTLAVGSTTGDAELIDGRIGADGITYANIGGAVRGQVSGLKSDVDANFTFVTQLLKASARVNGKYYYRDTHIKGDNADFAVYPEIPIYKGKTYNLVDAVGIFTTVSYDGGATATSLKLGTSTEVSDLSFNATGDGLLYVTTKTGTNAMVFDADYTQAAYAYVEGKTNWQLKNDSVGNQITKENCTFFKHLEQYLLKANKTTGNYYTAYSGVLGTPTKAETSIFSGVNLIAGETYTFINVYGYFTQIFDKSGVFIDKLTTSTGVSVTVTYTPSVNCVVYVSAYNTEVPMLVNSSNILPQKYIEGIYENVLDTVDTTLTQAGMAADAKTVGDKFPTTLTVKKDGTGDYTTVVAAVTQANVLSDAGKTVNINIYEGDYDLLAELGGSTFLSAIERSGEFAERQGLRLKKNVNLFGVGYVILRYELPDTATYVQSQCTSALNLYQTNSIENIEFIAKNCRYALHDETNGENPYLTRYIKNCRFTHLGNVPGLWEYPTVLGGGAGGGSDYTFINSQFITTTYGQAWSYHTNHNQVPSHFNVDGCVGIVKASGGNSFNCTYHGKGHLGKTIFNIKNCSGNGIVRKAAESDGSEDHIEVYTNGYVTLA
ncbi:BppU family phage baseplate upper protein [Lactococcus cremoris]|uniref:BppU family phage baseplate upper protein n=1 Tax=Lactococcus lactis subsp. cremoris TaxID=1359 RepID=UPI00300E5D27